MNCRHYFTVAEHILQLIDANSASQHYMHRTEVLGAIFITIQQHLSYRLTCLVHQLTSANQTHITYLLCHHRWQSSSRILARSYMEVLERTEHVLPTSYTYPNPDPKAGIDLPSDVADWKIATKYCHYLFHTALFVIGVECSLCLLNSTSI